ncbi:MAG: sulfotransferase, partial [Sneathiella sp.]
MNRALRRKQAGKGKAAGADPTKQIILPETTGLSHFQISQVKQIMTRARTAYQAKDYVSSERYCNECLAIYPLYAMPLALLSQIATKYEHHEAARELMEKSLHILPNVPGRLLLYAQILKTLGRHEDSLEAINKCLKLDPKSNVGLNRRAAALNVLGRQPEALKIYEKLIKSEPLVAGAFHSLSTQHKFTDGDSYCKYFNKLAANIESLTKDQEIMSAHFALGKYFEDLKQYKTGINHFFEANRLLNKDLNYEVDGEIAGVLLNKKRFPLDGRWIKETAAGNQTDIPVFIVGMPRSGTTLTEQVLASHPKIHGAGELKILGNNAGKIDVTDFPDKELLPENAEKLEKFRENIEAAALKLKTEFVSLAPEARHIVDKMPQNFINLGFKHLLLPNAKIIHCKRNPVDTCLSSFRLKFAEKLYFTTDLESLGKYYVAYSQLMDHWKEALGDRILEVEYEDTVDDLEKQARRIIDFVGVEWDDACLDFHKTKRSVNTASVNQVRQPIYKTAVGRHERYGDLLKPLLDALE